MKSFLRTWMLAIAMLLGVCLYFAWMALPFGITHEAKAIGVVKTVQPLLIFTMLFVTFCKVNVGDLTLRRWHAHLLAVQCTAFAILAALLYAFPETLNAPITESAMLCCICPTATAAVVVTGKLKGDMAAVTTYTLLINLAVALAIPSIVSWLHPHPTLGFSASFFLIMGKIFPMLIFPFFAALLVRQLWKSLHRRILQLKDFAFYLWAVSLALAITVSTKSIVETTASWQTLFGIGGASAVTCYLQFFIGRRIGIRHDNPVAAAQALGQKNTVFLIWTAYTFFDPVTSIAGGFYSIFHNLWNSYQLAQAAKKQ